MSARIPAIDGLRGIAILMVLYQHLYAGPVLGLLEKGSFGSKIAVSTAWFGVNIFFVLSGFVLAVPFLNGNRKMETREHAKTFLNHRAWRLLPLFAVSCFAGYAIQVATGQSANPLALLATLSTMTMFMHDWWFPPVNGVMWSLMIEIWFSAAFPLILFAIRRFGLGKVALCVFVMSFAVRAVGSYYVWLNPHMNPVRDSLPGRLDDFMAGIIMAKLYLDGRFKRFNPVWLAVSVALLVLSAYLWNLRVNMIIPRAPSAAINNLVQIAACILIAAALSERAGFRSLMQLWPLRAAGAMCFSLYAWHILFIGPVFLSSPFSLSSNFQYWLVLLVTAYLSFRFIEKGQLAAVKASTP